MGADFYFDTLNPPQQAAQMKVKRKYETFSEIVRVLLRAAPETLLSQWKEADERFHSAWIEFGTNYALTPDRSRNEAALRKDAGALEQILSVFEGIGDNGVLLVPDTNSLVDQPDPARYRSIARGRPRVPRGGRPLRRGERHRVERAHRRQPRHRAGLARAPGVDAAVPEGARVARGGVSVASVGDRRRGAGAHHGPATRPSASTSYFLVYAALIGLAVSRAVWRRLRALVDAGRRASERRVTDALAVIAAELAIALTGVPVSSAEPPMACASLDRSCGSEPRPRHGEACLPVLADHPCFALVPHRSPTSR